MIKEKDVTVEARTIEVEWERLGISNDFLFGKVMQDPELCKELLQMILPNLKIRRIEYPELQKEIRFDADAKSVRLDVYVEDGKGTVYDIEMQTTDTRELPRRTRYYQSMIDLQLIDKGEHYKKLKPCYIIFICTFDLFNKGRHIYTFENICKEDRRIALDDGAVKIFLNSEGTLDDVSPKLKAFLDYVAGRKTEDSYVNRLQAAITKAKQNRKWRHEYMTLLMRDQENIEKGRLEGEKIGRREGEKIGRLEGEKIGRLEGEKIGKEKILALTQRLVAAGRMDDIFKIGADEEYCQKLFKEFNILD